MRPMIAILLGMLPALLFGQESGDIFTRALIKKLGSANFQERQAASKALQARPEAAPALRELMRSPDPELQRRAADILDYYERRPLHELEAAVQDGRVDRAIELLTRWPKGKHENEVWSTICTLGRTLTDLHLRQKGEKTLAAGSWNEMAQHEHHVISEPKITEATKGPGKMVLEEKLLCLRATDVDLDYSRAKKLGFRSELEWISVIVASRSVRSFAAGYGVQAIFAGENIELDGGFSYLTIVSGGDVNLKDCLLAHALVIARGKVICGRNNYPNCRIIAGKAVENKPRGGNCIITENEPNPLGYIRWSDPPKTKPEPKSK